MPVDFAVAIKYLINLSLKFLFLVKLDSAV